MATHLRAKTIVEVSTDTNLDLMMQPTGHSTLVTHHLAIFSSHH